MAYRAALKNLEIQLVKTSNHGQENTTNSYFACF